MYPNQKPLEFQEGEEVRCMFCYKRDDKRTMRSFKDIRGRKIQEKWRCRDGCKRKREN